jgi:hypothetical protein
VKVSAAAGAKGAPAPVVTNRRIYGMSIADWMPADYVPVPNPKYLSYLQSLQPGILRWPAGTRSQFYIWERGGPGQSGDWVLTPDHLAAFMALAHAANAEPLLAINVKRGTVAAAQDLVHYANVEQNWGVRWLQLGNEPEADYSDLDSISDALNEFAKAVRDVDPSVRIVAPELFQSAYSTDKEKNALTPILARTKDIDAVSFHYFPLDSNQTDPNSSARVTIPHLLQETAPDWIPSGLSYIDQIMPVFTSIRGGLAPRSEFWITELGEDAGLGKGAGVSDTIAGALWVGDALGRLAEYGPGALVRWIFKATPADMVGLLDVNDDPRPTYGAYWLYARAFGDRWVDTTTSMIRNVSAHAALRSDGALTVMLVNKTSSTCRVQVAIDGFRPASADSLTLQGGGLASTSFQLNGQALTVDAAQGGIPPTPVDANDLFDVSMPDASIRVLVYRP